jgi:hypothetical protein
MTLSQIQSGIRNLARKSASNFIDGSTTKWQRISVWAYRKGSDVALDLDLSSDRNLPIAFVHSQAPLSRPVRESILLRIELLSNLSIIFGNWMYQGTLSRLPLF